MPSTGPAGSNGAGSNTSSMLEGGRRPAWGSRAGRRSSRQSRNSTSSADPERHEAPGGRLPRHVEEVDRLDLPRLDPAGPGRRRGRRSWSTAPAAVRRRRLGRRPPVRAVAAGPPTPPAVESTSRSRFSTNWRSSFADTSSSTPRPNCATFPVIDEIGHDLDARAVAVVVHRDDDRRLRVALPARVAAGRVDARSGAPPRRPRRAWPCPCTAR